MRPHKIKARCRPTPCNKSVGFRVSVCVMLAAAYVCVPPKTVPCYIIYTCNKYPEEFFTEPPPPKTEWHLFSLP